MIEASVTGNVGKEPVMRETATGKVMTTFSLASTEKKDGPTTWVDVVCFDEQATLVAEKVKKGDRLVCEGRLSLEKYERKDGSEGTSLRMVANEVGLSLRWPRRSREDRHEPEHEDAERAPLPTEPEVGDIPF